MEKYEELEALARNKCRITWHDDETDARVKGIVENAAYYLHHKLGIPGETSPDVFLEPGATRMLFENRCLYEWNDVADEFEENYKREILTERHRYEVEAARIEEEIGNI